MKSEDKTYLTSWNLLDLKGKLIYSEGSQAWNILRLRKEILTEFPPLKEKRSQLCYHVMFIRTYEDLLNHIKQMKDGNKPLPLLLWFYKVKEID